MTVEVENTQDDFRASKTYIDVSVTKFLRKLLGRKKKNNHGGGSGCKIDTSKVVQKQTQ